MVENVVSLMYHNRTYGFGVYNVGPKMHDKCYDKYL